MKNMILALGILFIGHSVIGQITDPSYKAKVKKLMDITMGHGVVMDEMVKQILPQIPEDKHEDFKKDMKTVMDKMMDKIADISMEVYTKNEVDALLGFYNSPIGQEIQGKLPVIMKKTADIQREIQMDLMPLMQKYLR